MRTQALFLPNWIGDVVMTTPAIRAIRERFPDDRMIAVCKPYVSAVIAGAPWFDRVVTWERRQFWSVRNILKAEQVDWAVLFPNSFRSALLVRLAGSRRVVGYARYGRDLLLTDRLYYARDRRGGFLPTPIIDDYFRLARKLGAGEVPPGDEHRMELFTTTEDECQVDQVWKQLDFQGFSRVVGFNPGGAFGSSKHWSTQSFVELARSFAKRGVGVMVLCGPSEREVAAEIARKADHSLVRSLGEFPLSIGLTKAVVRRLQMLVTTDSGPRHFAAAFDVPVVSLFGPTHIEWTETYFDKAIHLQHKLDCGPCQKRVCPLGHHRCMTELTPEQVFSAAWPLLEKNLVLKRESRHVG